MDFLPLERARRFFPRRYPVHSIQPKKISCHLLFICTARFWFASRKLKSKSKTRPARAEASGEGGERACRATACRARAAPPNARPRTASQLAAPPCIDPPLPPAVPPGRPRLAPRPRGLQLQERVAPRCSCHCRMHLEKGGPLTAGNPAACFLRASALICAPQAARRGPTDVLTPACLA